METLKRRDAIHLNCISSFVIGQKIHKQFFVGVEHWHNYFSTSSHSLDLPMLYPLRS